MEREQTKRRALVTGGAGFIGFHLCKKLLDDGWIVTSYDGMTPYYDPELKRQRIALLQRSNAFHAVEAMLEDQAALRETYASAAPDVVIHLAAQAGVRYSLESPRTYVETNVLGTFNVIELVREFQPKHFLLASTSSVYGANTTMPFGENDRTDQPMTIYAATKKATEAMTFAYAHLWNVPTTAFRFFTVYGPWGRPDMALFKFVKAILEGQPIDVYGEGRMRRDFTYIDDLIEAIVRLIDAVPVIGRPVSAHDSLSAAAPFRVVNIGGGKPVELIDFIRIIERCLGRIATLNILPMQPGELAATEASTALIEALTGFRPAVPVAEGVARFIDWYRAHYAGASGHRPPPA